MFKRVQRGIAEEIHRISRKTFARRAIKIYGLHEIWGMDLLDMKAYQSQNKHFRYILLCVDLLSKFIYCEAIKKKNAVSVHEALAKILRKSKPQFIWSDRGLEFYNAKVKELLRKKQTTLYHTFTKIKCSPAQIANKSIKSRIVRYFSANNTKNGSTFCSRLFKIIMRLDIRPRISAN